MIRQVPSFRVRPGRPRGGRALLLSLGLLSAFVPSTLLASEDPDAASAIVGVWAAERHFGPEVAGRLTIWRHGEDWSAEIAGFDVEVEREGDRLRFQLPGDRGSFRGRFDEKEGSIEGHWIQPATPSLGAAYATPVRFADGGNGRWQGEVEPLEDRLRLYLRFFREAREGEEGTVTRAVMRNPERNTGIFLRIDHATVEGERVAFRRKDGTTALTGWLEPDDDGVPARVLRVFFEGVGNSFDFRRADRDRATGFHASVSTSRAHYVSPRDRGDGWRVASATDRGIDIAPLEAMVRTIEETETTSVYDPYIHSILVAHQGRLVFEEYFYGHGPAMPHDTRSAGKSVASMLGGWLMDRDEALGPDTRVVSVFGDRAAEPEASTAETPRAERASWRRSMTIGHLLSMSGGLDCDDNDESSPGNEGTLQSQDAEPDWARYTLGLATVRAPGSRGIYCSVNINLGLATIAEATGAWLPEAFATGIAAPLGIERYHMNLTPTGEGYMGGGIRLTPRDQLKLGQVMLDGGTWNGKRVLSAAWVEDSLAVHAGINEPDDYGYGWWRTSLESPKTGQRYDVFHASGNGGQFIILVPDLALVVQFSGGNYVNFPVWMRFLRELVPRHILPAVEVSASAGRR